MSSAVSVTPLEEEIAVKDANILGQQETTNVYLLKFACASLSSTFFFDHCRRHPCLSTSGMTASGVTNPFDMYVCL
jgi:hypothetical protein